MVSPGQDALPTMVSIPMPMPMPMEAVSVSVMVVPMVVEGVVKMTRVVVAVLLCDPGRQKCGSTCFQRRC